MDEPFILPSALDAGIIKTTQQLTYVEALLNTDVNPVVNHCHFEIAET
jgi:hypothetical protein